MITENEFQAYKNIQLSGVTNMFDLKTVSLMSGLCREKLIEIQQNYTQLEERRKGKHDKI